VRGLGILAFSYLGAGMALSSVNYKCAKEKKEKVGVRCLTMCLELSSTATTRIESRPV
jgi:hypothetical protein